MRQCHEDPGGHNEYSVMRIRVAIMSGQCSSLFELFCKLTADSCKCFNCGQVPQTKIFIVKFATAK